MIKFTLILIYLFSIFFISIIYKKYNEENKEVLRKIIHIGIGPLIPIAQYLNIDQQAALIFTAVMSLLIFLNYLYRLFPTIEDVDRKSFGTLFYCLSLFILIFLFWDKDPNSLIAGFLIMTFGDGLAGLIGKSFNSQIWFVLRQKKSLFGTMTMFVTSLIVLCSLGYFDQNSFNLNYFIIALSSLTISHVLLINFFNKD